MRACNFPPLPPDEAAALAARLAQAGEAPLSSEVVVALGRLPPSPVRLRLLSRALSGRWAGLALSALAAHAARDADSAQLLVGAALDEHLGPDALELLGQLRFTGGRLLGPALLEVLAEPMSAQVAGALARLLAGMRAEHLPEALLRRASPALVALLSSTDSSAAEAAQRLLPSRLSGVELGPVHAALARADDLASLLWPARVLGLAQAAPELEARLDAPLAERSRRAAEVVAALAEAGDAIPEALIEALRRQLGRVGVQDQALHALARAPPTEPVLEALVALVSSPSESPWGRRRALDALRRQAQRSEVGARAFASLRAELVAELEEW